MKNFETIQFSVQQGIAQIVLNRPDVRNAFNERMISELREAFSMTAGQEELFALIIKGEGSVFSAGADLNWMKTSMDNDFEQHKQESSQLQKMFEELYQLPVPTIAVIHGACIGGANGLAAASDVVLAETATQFRFSEVRVGLVPATIAPYVMHRMGAYQAKYYMLTGRTFRHEEALRTGLADAVGSREKMDTELELILKELSQNSPQAMRNTKKLMNRISRSHSSEQIKEWTVEAIARARLSEDGQEGMQAFLEKRKPRWQKQTDD